MELPWSPPQGLEVDAPPPWVRHSRLQTQQELCAKRFLRFASLHHVHGAVALWATALWFSGMPFALACAPCVYFTGLVALGRRHLPVCSLEHLSLFILALNFLNALHLAALCVMQGDRILSSPMYAFVPLSRVLIGLFTQEVHFHLGLSTTLSFLAISCNSKRVAGGETLLVVLAVLLLELTAVVVLAEGPCGYEEAIMHLAQCRAQHQLTRSQALQRIDVEREEFAGQLLAIASQGIAELTAAVHRASEPVLNMLKTTCATGTKSAREAERIGRIGEALKEEVAEILRYKTQLAWSRLQERAKERTHHLREHAAAQQVASESVLRYVQQSLGRSLAQVHELELEAEASWETMIQGEVSRAMETADARMDLVRQSAQAMERRVSDTVEVLLSLLKYFRTKGSTDHTHPVTAVPRKLASPKDARSQERRKGQLPAIHEQAPGGGAAATPATPAANVQAVAVKEGREEGARPTDAAEVAEDEEDEASSMASTDRHVLSGSTSYGPAQDTSSAASDGGAAACSRTSSVRSIRGSDPDSHNLDSPSGEEVGAAARGGRAEWAGLKEAARRAAGGGLKDGKEWEAGRQLLEIGSDSGHSDRQAGGSIRTGGTWTPPEPAANHKVDIGGGISVGRAALERHPLFASRLCYRSDDFFWSWASSRDFRAEADALRQWQRAAALRPAHTSPPPPGGAMPQTATPTEPTQPSTARSAGGSSCAQEAAATPESGLLPVRVYVDLSVVDLKESRRMSSSAASLLDSTMDALAQEATDATSSAEEC